MSQKTSRFYAFGPFVADARRRLLSRAGARVALASKAFDLLIALIEHRGEILEKEALLKLVWPEQFVEEANISVNMSALRKALGERAKESRFIATVPRRGYRFVADVRELEDDASERESAEAEATKKTTKAALVEERASRGGDDDDDEGGAARPDQSEARINQGDARPEPLSAGEVADNLPIQLTPFVGRASEMSAVKKLLLARHVRLVTLTGAGGCGKTRLALEVARESLTDFPDGVFFVALESVREARLLVAAVAQTLGVRETSGETLEESLKRYLRERRMLLALDNFEQIISASPALAEILSATLNLKMLVTSRALLRLTGEREFRVPSLELPGLRETARVSELLRYSSIELFVQRAEAAHSGFQLTRENAQAVAEICARLDGLPLAIELAAARVRLLTPRAMLERLKSPMRFLTGGARNLPARQQTMREAIDWSYDLLDDERKRLFQTLSVFAGGATLEAAEAVCKDSSGANADVEEGVGALVDNSLLRQLEQPGGEPRFVMLETIREYGLERLRADGRDEEALLRHARHFLELAERADTELGGELLNFRLEQLEQEHDNLRAALRWALENDEEETALRLVRSLWWFWYLHGHYSEGRDWISRALSATSRASSPFRARALVGAGVLAFLRCEYEEAEGSLNEALSMAREVGDEESSAMALQVLGSVARERGFYAEAVKRHKESLALWRERNDRRGVARSLNYIGFASWLARDFKETVRCCEAALPMFREQGDKEGVVWSLLNLAHVALYRRAYARAAALGEESLSLSREMGYKEGVAWSLHLLGETHRRARRFERAEEALRESILLHQELGDRWRLASALESFGVLAVALKRPQICLQLFAAAETLREATGAPLPPVEREAYERSLKELREELGAKRFKAAWTRSRALPVEKAVAAALEFAQGD